MALQTALNDLPGADEIRSRPCSSCYLCGAPGELLYEGLKDRLHGAPGTWNLKRCPDTGCGLIWVDPMPIEEDLHRAYRTYFTHVSAAESLAYRFRQRVKRGYAGLAYGYSQQVALVDCLLALPLAFLHSLREQAVASGLMYLRGERPGRLLEIGCGSGTFLAGMRLLGWQVEGIDTDPQAIKIARNNYSLDVRQGKLEEQKYSGSNFDAIVMSHVLEHLHDPLALLSECRRILVPGGTLVITTPNVQSQGHRRFRSAWVHLDPPRHLHLFSRTALGNIVTRSGLKPVKLRSTIRLARDVWILSDYIRRDGVTQMDRKGNWRMKLHAAAFRAREALSLLFDRAAGEELLLIASNNDNGA